MELHGQELRGLQDFLGGSERHRHPPVRISRADRLHGQASLLQRSHGRPETISRVSNQRLQGGSLQPWRAQVCSSEHLQHCHLLYLHLRETRSPHLTYGDGQVHQLLSRRSSPCLSWSGRGCLRVVPPGLHAGGGERDEERALLVCGVQPERERGDRLRRRPQDLGVRQERDSKGGRDAGYASPAAVAVQQRQDPVCGDGGGVHSVLHLGGRGGNHGGPALCCVQRERDENGDDAGRLHPVRDLRGRHCVSVRHPPHGGGRGGPQEAFGPLLLPRCGAGDARRHGGEEHDHVRPREQDRRDPSSV
mmetsp:Transcript_827/g.2522  ORF Transcript_827/g.2522 Transcript_827/m.2522 type:complete len:305 (+) Transcript_827:1209-2123(+)